MTVCACGAEGEFVGVYFNGNCKAYDDLHLNTKCGTGQQWIVIGCGSCDFSFKDYYLKEEGTFFCDNCKRVIDIDYALNLVSKYGEALTSFGAMLMSIKESLNAKSNNANSTVEETR